MVTAATSLGDWKHVYTEAVIRLLMLTSHTTIPPKQNLGDAYKAMPHLSTAC